MRARELGIVIGRLQPGPRDAITDVAGVRVGHATIIEGDGPLVVGRGPVRTGVTVILPHDGDVWNEPVFAGCHRLNGNGELTGLEWIREAGQLGGAIAITNTHSVGIVRDALVAHSIRHRQPRGRLWSLPVVGETWDGLLNDIDGLHVRPEHVDAALADAEAGADGRVAEGNVGGGTGMVCHDFKGGIGTASRQVDGEGGPWTVGALVQANYGNREDLRIDGVPVGAALGLDAVPSPYAGQPVPPGSGSIIGILATDAPLLPHQAERLAHRAALGVARMGSTANHSSGDLFLAFATGNRAVPSAAAEPDGVPLVASVRMVPDARMTPLFKAAVEATEAAIVAALLAAETMTGRDGVIAHALGAERLIEVMARYGRGPRKAS
ncbi:MAG TPA: P1 family peptidase [Candidatus Limnocylindrales bacterium]|nr:P1 family peptidase [Candidatus Limnocylindrales bacterium]